MVVVFLWVYAIALIILATSSELVVPGFEHLFKEQKQKHPTLVLLHVLFRHGNRTGQPNELYPKDPYLNYTYFPFGNGQLTNAGKRREYSIGKGLSERYGTFLGEYYYPEIVNAVSTDYNRTKMSLELVLASLFPPRGEEMWKYNLNWQPVPYNYLPSSEDKVLQGIVCPNYIKNYNEVIASPKQQAEFNKYQKDFDYISQSTGLNVAKFADVYNLFFGLATEEEWGFELPQWTKKVWPNIITDIAIREYFVATSTTDLKKMASGYFIKNVIAETKKKIRKGAEEHGRKIYLYSAHESNLAHLLILLNIFKPSHIPTYGSYIVFEVHKLDKIYGIKIYYQNYLSNDIQLLKLPGCEEICPFDKFISLNEEYIPSDELCGN